MKSFYRIFKLLLACVFLVASFQCDILDAQGRQFRSGRGFSPQYSSPQYGQPQYQPQYSQPQYGQPYGQPVGQPQYVQPQYQQQYQSQFQQPVYQQSQPVIVNSQYPSNGYPVVQGQQVMNGTPVAIQPCNRPNNGTAKGGSAAFAQKSPSDSSAGGNSVDFAEMRNDIDLLKASSNRVAQQLRELKTAAGNANNGDIKRLSSLHEKLLTQQQDLQNKLVVANTNSNEKLTSLDNELKMIRQAIAANPQNDESTRELIQKLKDVVDDIPNIVDQKVKAKWEQDKSEIIKQAVAQAVGESKRQMEISQQSLNTESVVANDAIQAAASPVASENTNDAEMTAAAAVPVSIDVSTESISADPLETNPVPAEPANVGPVETSVISKVDVSAVANESVEETDSDSTSESGEMSSILESFEESDTTETSTETETDELVPDDGAADETVESPVEEEKTSSPEQPGNQG